MRKAEDAAYALAYWFVSRLCPSIFPTDRVELAAETAIRYYVTHLTESEALSYIRTYRLCESEFWKSL